MVRTNNNSRESHNVNWHTMNIESFVTAAFAAILGWVGLAVRGLYNNFSELKQALHNHQVEAAKTYATKSDLIRFEGKIDDIREILERKVDRD